MVIATIRKSRPLMKRDPLSWLFPTEDAGTDDDIEFVLVGTAVIDTITRIIKQWWCTILILN